MPPTNCSGGRDFETTRRFQTASPASHRPGLRPTRGSGLGAAEDIADDEAMGALVVVTAACEQAPIVASATAASAPRVHAVRAAGIGTDVGDVISSIGEVR